MFLGMRWSIRVVGGKGGSESCWMGENGGVCSVELSRVGGAFFLE